MLGTRSRMRRTGAGDRIQEADVVIVGGGPFGLMLSIELGRRGVTVILFDEKTSTAFNPQANATQARTMEHYRRLGFADEVRGVGLPDDYPTDIAYFTRFSKHELARIASPSASEARRRLGTSPDSWSGPELPHRVSQKFVEQILHNKASALGGVSLRYGWRVDSFQERSDGVLTEATNVGTGERTTVAARYLAAGDGARSFIRSKLGIHLQGETGVVRDFFGGRMCALYLRAPTFYDVVPHRKAWMHVTFNQDRRAFMCAVDGRGEFAFHTQLRDWEDESLITDRDARAMFEAAVGVPIEARILSRGTWTAGHALVADRFTQGCVFLGGDAAHLFTPAGGLGYNTAVDDAVNLGWKLAATIRGDGGAGLLQSYELERRPVALRNTAYARGFAESLGLFVPKDGLEADDESGQNLRREAGAYLEAHGRSEFNIAGITLGARYDGSPIIVGDGLAAPPDSAHSYIPTAVPGGRPPHVWLDKGSSLYDRFGFEWTLLRLGDEPARVAEFESVASRTRMEIKVVDIAANDVRDTYGAPLALIRPDQVVAWRGTSDRDAEAIVAAVTGR
jgi:2-polyprenyl-6-methoxyphenol hydroxylase-like FAD-dependent oxidoreductase